jgi:hypothetical protein
VSHMGLERGLGRSGAARWLCQGHIGLSANALEAPGYGLRPPRIAPSAATITASGHGSVSTCDSSLTTWKGWLSWIGAPSGGVRVPITSTRPLGSNIRESWACGLPPSGEVPESWPSG